MHVAPSVPDPRSIVITPLEWGLRHVLVEPSHLSPGHPAASEQWRGLVATIERLGGTVEALPQRADAPDMVRARSLGLAVVRPDGQQHVVMSHHREPERRVETLSARPWFGAHGFTTSYVGREGIGAFLDAGDLVPWADGLLAACGRRTEELALKHLAVELGVRVRGLRLAGTLDRAFCPLDATRALVRPTAFDGASVAALLALVPEPLVLTDDEAQAAGSIVVGRTVVMPSCSSRVRTQLEEWGFEVEVVDVAALPAAGGSVRALVNPVDVVIGRDLPSLPAGEVVVPTPA